MSENEKPISGSEPIPVATPAPHPAQVDAAQGAASSQPSGPPVETSKGAIVEIVEGQVVQVEVMDGQVMDGQVVEGQVVDVPESVFIPEVVQLGSDLRTSESSKNRMGHNLVFRATPAPPNFALIGSAVTSLVLGIWSILGATLTTYAAINGFLGFFFGLLGLASNRQKTAIVGLVLSLVGILLCLTNFFVWASQFLETESNAVFTEE